MIILHDTFLYRGGGERLVMYMRNILDCDLAAGFFDPGSYSCDEILAQADPLHLPKIRELTQSRIFTKGVRHIKLKLAFLYRTKFLKNYRTVIFSGDCLAAVRNVAPDTHTVFYCHTPPRYIFDKREWYESQLHKHYGFVYLLVRPLYRFVRDRFERAYRADISKMDMILVNSYEVQQRLLRYFGLSSTIVHPPVDLTRFQKSTQQVSKSEEYYLSFGRLAEFKRVDLIIEAFARMTDKNLIITYGKNDPVKDTLIKMAEPYPNIQFRTNVSDDEAVHLLSHATATIYIPKDEDFGMVPIESMACGTPVIGVAEGGLKETIIPGKTGELIAPENIVENLIEAVKSMSSDISQYMQQECVDRAKEFGLDTFSTQIRQLVTQPVS